MRGALVAASVCCYNEGNSGGIGLLPRWPEGGWPAGAIAGVSSREAGHCCFWERTPDIYTDNIANVSDICDTSVIDKDVKVISYGGPKTMASTGFVA